MFRLTSTSCPDQVGLTDDWIGAVIDAFVIDYVFDRPSVIGETIRELAPPTRARFAATRIQHTSTTAPGPIVLTAPAHSTERRRRVPSTCDKTGYWVTRSAVGLIQRVPPSCEVWGRACGKRTTETDVGGGSVCPVRNELSD